MPITNTAAFAQFRRTSVATVTTANTDYSSPANLALLAVAGPDGSLVTQAASVPRATVTATQMQFFLSKNGGTSYSFFNSSTVPAGTVGLTAAFAPTPLTQVDGTALSETNPLALSGVNAYGTSAPIAGGTSQGSANAQTLPFATAVTTLTDGLIVDFEAGLTNTTSMTLTVGTSAAASVVRDISGSAVSAGDITTGFRYRVRCDGSFWRLLITDRLYVGMGVTLSDGIVTTVQQADF